MTLNLDNTGLTLESSLRGRLSEKFQKLLTGIKIYEDNFC